MTGRVFSVLVAFGLAGCSLSTSSFDDASSVGGAIVGGVGLPVGSPPAGAPSLGALLEGPIGQRLDAADRDRAYQAELDAVASGTRKTWRGAKATFGYVAPASVAGPDGCRSFSHTIYIGGRPLTGTGAGCPAPDGAWKITG